MKKKVVAGLLAIMMLTGCGAGSTGNTGNISGRSGAREYSSTNVAETAEPLVINAEDVDIEDEWINSLSASSMNLLNEILETEGEGRNIMISSTSMVSA